MCRFKDSFIPARCIIALVWLGYMKNIFTMTAKLPLIKVFMGGLPGSSLVEEGTINTSICFNP